MEILENDELLAILGRNDILGEHPCQSMTSGKSRCVVRGMVSRYLLLFCIDTFDCCLN